MYFKILLKFLAISLILGILLRFFALWRSQQLAFFFLSDNGTYIWALFLFMALPSVFYVFYLYYVEFKHIWYKAELPNNFKPALKQHFTILILALINISIFTLNFENFTDRINDQGVFENPYVELYITCDRAPPDMKIFFSKDCR